MFGIDRRELVLVTLLVVLGFAFFVGSFHLSPPYDAVLKNVWYWGVLIAAAFLIIRWFIRRRRH
jgi:hypothetical protein